VEDDKKVVANWLRRVGDLGREGRGGGYLGGGLVAQLPANDACWVTTDGQMVEGGGVERCRLAGLPWEL
jgi:hypothetical protein